MYNASATFQNLIKADERLFSYSGKIVANGQTYNFTGDDMRSGKIVRSVCDNALEIGTAHAAEFDCGLALNVSRYGLYGGKITPSIELDGASDVIPMGEYNISEINQTADRLNIKAYDNMVKFDDVPFSAADHTTVQFPYDWLVEMCTACGVTLGMTSAQIRALPNGNRKTGFADVVTDVKSWRDVLRYLMAYLCSYAYIGRDGKLYAGSFTSVSADVITSSFRYTSNLSDYRTTYDGLYAVYKAEGTQEYVSNTNSGGLVLDLGINPFLQFTDSNNRHDALQEIIDAWNGIYYVPYTANIPMNPLYDVGDILEFSGNQADQYDKGAITEIVLSIGNQMSITCSGDNPRLASAEDRFTKSIAGLSADYSNGQEIGGKDFWLKQTMNDATISVGSTKTKVAQIDWSQSVDVQELGLMVSFQADLSATAIIKILITVDDSANYEFEQIESKRMKGSRPCTETCGFEVIGKGSHSAIVYVTVTDSPTLWSDMV